MRGQGINYDTGFSPGGPGTGHHGLGWEPKLAFGAWAAVG